MVRDLTERGRDLEQILNQYMTFVKPAFEEFCSPVSISPDKHFECLYYTVDFHFNSAFIFLSTDQKICRRDHSTGR